MLATYLYKLTNKLGVPSYHLMAAVAVCIVAITFPLVLLQRWLLKSANRFVTVKGRRTRQTVLPLGAWRGLRWRSSRLWLLLTVFVPLSGITLRAFVTNWGEGVNLAEVLTLANFTELFEQDNLVRAILNTLGIGVIGGALAVGFYSLVAFAGHRRNDGRRANARLPRAAAARGARPARRSRVPVDLSLRAGPEGTEELHVEHLDRVHGGVARVRACA